MFYSVEKISDHPCFAMQELIYSVFYNAALGEPFGKKVFPDEFSTTNRLWGYLRSLKDEFESLYEKLLKLNELDRKRIYSQLCDNNMVELLCEDITVVPDTYLDWKSGIGKDIKEVIALCYKKLDLSHFKRTGCELKPTHRFYRDYIKVNKSVCPFCAINSYKNPLSPRREDFDHYLCKSKYPLAAANMDNLIPMCSECNQDYKKNIDVLYEEDNRVVAFYPFSQLAGISIRITSTLDLVSPFYRRWSVELVANDASDAQKVANWNRVFSIEARLINEISEYYDEWMKQALGERKGRKFTTVATFRAHMKNRSKVEAKNSDRRNEPKALLKSVFYEYVQKDADDIFIESYIRMFNESVQA